MEHYWELSYMNNIGEVFRHDIKLYNHKSVSIILCSTNEFMQAFSNEFSQFGKFSSVQDNDYYNEGWFFKVQEQDRLTNLLKNIFNNTIKPKNKTEIKPEGNTVFNTIINVMDVLKDLKKDNKDILKVIKDNIETTIIFDEDSGEKREGENIYNFDCSCGKISIYQKEIPKENVELEKKEDDGTG